MDCAACITGAGWCLSRDGHKDLSVDCALCVTDAGWCVSHDGRKDLRVDCAVCVTDAGWFQSYVDQDQASQYSYSSRRGPNMVNKIKEAVNFMRNQRLEVGYAETLPPFTCCFWSFIWDYTGEVIYLEL